MTAPANGCVLTDAGTKLTHIQWKSFLVEAWIAVQPLIPQVQSRDWDEYTEAETPHFPLSQTPNPHCHWTIQLCPTL